MKNATLEWLRRIGSRPAARAGKNSKRRPLVESLEGRVALSGLAIGPVRGAVASTAATQSLVASNVRYTVAANTPLVVSAPGLLAYVSPRVSGLTANFGGTGPSHGALSINPNGSFTYTPSINYSGSDQFTYYATAGSSTSNVATVFITVKASSTTLVPGTPFYNALRRRWSLDPARFDYYHPRVGAIFGLEASGIPDKPTTILSANKDFNVTAASRFYQRNPQRFDARFPIIGALFQLETPASAPSSLLPDTPYYTKQRALFESDPSRYQSEHFYLGAMFALEDLELD